MILVVGGTGRLGRAVVALLSAAGHDVRVLTRDASHSEGLPGHVVVGDVRDAASLATATRGCSVVISAAHGFLGGRRAGPEAVDNQGNKNLIHAAEDAGTEHFVLISVFDARPDHPMSLHRSKYAAEQALCASGLSWTVLRPTSYIETWIEVIAVKLPSGGPAMIFGRGNNPINFVSVTDVAAAVERAATDPTFRYRTVDLAGPENLTMTQLAEGIGPAKIRHIPRPVLRALSLLAPLAPAPARQATGAMLMATTDMTADTTVFNRVFPDVNRRHASDVAAQWVTAHQTDQGGSPPA
jgi:uncharacterized protein YbjT (DUF2867 family)